MVHCPRLQGIGLGLLLVSIACTNPRPCRGELSHQAPVSQSAPNATTSARESPAVESLAGRIDDFLTRMSGFGYSGNVLIMQHGALVLKKGYGLANRADHIPYDADTVFDIGSMAKTFTAAAVMKLEIEGRLSVNDPIGKFLEKVPDDKRAISIQQLLTHTSGLTVDFPFSDPSTPYEDVSRDEALRRILAAPLDYPPGTDKAYSNTGYIVLAAIIEVAAKMPFRDYMRLSVFGPAGLAHTGFWAESTLDRRKVALGYNEYGEPVHDPMTRSATTWADLGGGQMLSTLSDLERWREGLASGRFLPAEVVARMWKSWTPQLMSPVYDYGYGWLIGHTARQTTVIQHGGDYLGTGAELRWYREEDVVMITSTNVRHDLNPTRNATDRVIPKIIFGGDHPDPPAWAPNDALLRQSLGTYQLPDGGSLTIHERGGRFFIGASGQDATDLLMTTKDGEARRRAAHTVNIQIAMDGVREGNLAAMQELAGGASANPKFVQAVVDEIAGLGRGPLRKDRVLGTFASGYPRGQPLDYDTTLVRLDFDDSTAYYAIRWGNDHLASSEVPAFHFAADTQIQPDGKGGLVTWNIVFNFGVTIEAKRNGSTIASLVVHSPGGDVVATRTPSP